MQVEKLVQETDGSSWGAVVRVQGVIFVASYVANRLSVHLGPYKHAPRRPRWAEEHVKRWAEKQVAELPAEWIHKHQALYA